MTTITILSETTETYRAVAGDKESTGRTPGEALDALTSQLADEENGTLVIVQNYNADQFFNAAQQERLTELLMLSKSGNLSTEEENELESLVEAELDGARRRVEYGLLPKVEDLPMSTLTESEMELMIMYFIDGLSVEEIAKELSINPGMARYNLNKVMARIRYSMKRRDNPAAAPKS
jgi:DNA-directed RNA polymerase specialized sigma24 family protein